LYFGGRQDSTGAALSGGAGGLFYHLSPSLRSNGSLRGAVYPGRYQTWNYLRFGLPLNDLALLVILLFENPILSGYN